MKKILLVITLAIMLSTRVSAMDFTAPEVPESGKAFMQEEPESFAKGLWSILKEAIGVIKPTVAEAAEICLSIIAVVLLISIIKLLPNGTGLVVEIVGTLAIAAVLLRSYNTLIHLGTKTVSEMSEYNKLLLPVLTAALAAQGGTATSAALYTGTVWFNTFLSGLVSGVIVPLIYVYLALSVASSAVNQEMLQKLKAFVKWLMTWCLKIVLYIFTGYMGITGAVSGSADAAAVKATKLTISGMVPVVGGILSDASETILVGAGVMKSAAGVYGLLAVIAICVGPFVEIGVQYLLLKLTNAISGIFTSERTIRLLQDFTTAMGMILAMTGTVCLLQLISIVCFMKGMG